MIDVVGTIQPDVKRELPDGWRWVQLGDVCDAIRGVTFATGEMTTSAGSGSIACLTTSGVQDKVDWESRRFIPENKVRSQEQVLHDGDLLVSTANSKALVGKSCLIESLPFPCTFGAFVTVLRPNSKINSRLLAHWMRTPEVLDYCFQASSNTTNISNLRVSELLTFEIPLPPLAEQQRIAALLNDHMATVEQARAAAEAQLAAAKELPAAYLRAVFESDEAREWTMVKLGDLAILGPDNGAFKRRTEFGSGVPFINVSDLYKGLTIDLSSVERVEASKNELTRNGIAPGDIFFCRSSLKREGIGWCAYVSEVPEPTIFDCHIMRIRLNPAKALPEYVAYYWQHPKVRQAVIDNSRTATMTTMNQEDLSKVEIPIPPMDVEKRVVKTVADQFSSVERICHAIEAQLDTINHLPAALLRRAFAGEL